MLWLEQFKSLTLLAPLSGFDSFLMGCVVYFHVHNLRVNVMHAVVVKEIPIQVPNIRFNCGVGFDHKI